MLLLANLAAAQSTLAPSAAPVPARSAEIEAATGMLYAVRPHWDATNGGAVVRARLGVSQRFSTELVAIGVVEPRCWDAPEDYCSERGIHGGLRGAYALIDRDGHRLEAVGGIGTAIETGLAYAWAREDSPWSVDAAWVVAWEPRFVVAKPGNSWWSEAPLPVAVQEWRSLPEVGVTRTLGDRASIRVGTLGPIPVATFGWFAAGGVVSLTGGTLGSHTVARLAYSVHYGR